MKRNLLAMISLVSWCVFCFYSNAHAVSVVNVLSVCVEDAEGSNVANQHVEVKDDSNEVLSSGQTGNDGCVNLWGPLDNYTKWAAGSYSLRIMASFNPPLQHDTGPYHNTIKDITVDPAQAAWDGDLSANVQSFGTETLVVATKYFKVSITEAAGSQSASAVGDPIDDVDVDAWAVDNPPGPNSDGYYGVSGSNGIAYVVIDEQEDGMFEVRAHKQGYADDFEKRNLVAGAGAEEIDAELIKADATINVNLVDKDGASFSVPADLDDGFAGIDCHQGEKDDFLHFHASLNPGDSSKQVPVAAGDYFCRAHVPGHGSTETSVSVASGATESIDLKVIQKDAAFKLRAINSITKEVVSGVDMVFMAWTSPFTKGGQIQDFSDKFTDQGQETLEVIDGLEYEVGMEIPNQQGHKDTYGMVSDGATDYIVPHELVTVLAKKEETPTIDFELIPATASVKVTLKDPQGDLVPYGFAAAVSKDPSDPKGKEKHTGAPIKGGMADIPLLAGLEYEIMAFPEFKEDKAMLPAAAVKLTPKEGKQYDVVLQLKEPNHILTINTYKKDSGDLLVAGTFSFLTCFGFNPATEQHSFVDNFDGDASVELPLIVEGAQVLWHVGCHSVVDGESGKKFYHGEVDYTPKKGSSVGEVDIYLKDGGEFYPEQVYEFKAEQGGTFVLADEETSIIIPAGAIGSTGQVQMAIQSGKGFTFTDENYPLTNFDIKFQLEGQDVTTTQKPVTISFPISADELAELGIDAEALAGSSFDTSTKVWKKGEAVVTYVDGVLSLAVSHFSIWAAVADLSSASGGLSGLKVKKHKKNPKKRKLCWKAGANAEDGQEYTVQIKKIKKKNKNSWDTGVKNIMTQKTCVVKKLKKGRYVFRVKEADSITAQYSNEKKFKVKW